MGAWYSWSGCRWLKAVSTNATFTRLPPVFATQPFSNVLLNEAEIVTAQI